MLLAYLLQLIGLLRNAPLDLVSVIDDFGGLIYAEIDYEVEAANAARFSRLYSQLPNVTAPSIFLPLSTSKVLTMEWVDGARLTSLTCDPTDEVRCRHSRTPLAPPYIPLYPLAPLLYSPYPPPHTHPPTPTYTHTHPHTPHLHLPHTHTVHPLTPPHTPLAPPHTPLARPHPPFAPSHRALAPPQACDIDKASYIIDTLVQCTLRQMLQNGFFHADPHMGNLLVNAEGAPHRRTAAPPHRPRALRYTAAHCGT